ncbi:MAG: phosphoribosylamine--glycine ligase [Elusimicrobiota bacterium]
MNILVIGSGGREHAIIWKLKYSPRLQSGGRIFCISGNAGIKNIAECQNIDILDFQKITEFVAKNKIDLTIVGPEVPLSEGIVDYFTKKKLKIFGPNRKAAQLEASKIFAKQFMKKYGIPTANFEVFDNCKKALGYLSTFSHSTFSVVIKADGLASGKGVFVCNTKQEAENAVKSIMIDKNFGSSGNKIIIEEKLEGEETSLVALCDGKTILPLIPSQDHKQIFDDDKGPNTGGMGAYAPARIIDEQIIKKLIFDRFLKGIKREKLNYKGIIYVGIMVTKKGPKVLEFNVRFGDPETQVILPLLKTDLLDLFFATVDGKLNKCKIEWKNGYCVSVVFASGGYPGKYEIGKEIFGLNNLNNIKDVIIFNSGTKFKTGKYYTNGGRVLSISAVDTTLKKTISKVYKNIKKIKFEDMHYRQDIGRKGL